MSRLENVEWEQGGLQYVGGNASEFKGGRPNREWLKISVNDSRRSERQARSHIKAAIESDKPTSIWIGEVEYCPGDLRDIREGDPKVKRDTIKGMAFRARVNGEFVLESGISSDVEMDKIAEPQAHI